MRKKSIIFFEIVLVILTEFRKQTQQALIKTRPPATRGIVSARKLSRFDVPEIFSAEQRCFTFLTYFGADSGKKKNISANDFYFIKNQRCLSPNSTPFQQESALKQHQFLTLKKLVFSAVLNWNSAVRSFSGSKKCWNKPETFVNQNRLALDFSEKSTLVVKDAFKNSHYFPIQNCLILPAKISDNELTKDISQNWYHFIAMFPPLPILKKAKCSLKNFHCFLLKKPYFRTFWELLLLQLQPAEKMLRIGDKELQINNRPSRTGCPHG